MVFDSEEFRDFIRTLLNEAEAHRLKQQGLSDKEHVSQHQWLEANIKAQEELAAMWKSIRLEVAKKGTLFLATVLALAVLYGLAGAWAKISGSGP